MVIVENNFIGCTLDQLIFMMDWDLIDIEENKAIFKLHGFCFLWSIKYYYFEFEYEKVVSVKQKSIILNLSDKIMLYFY